MREDIRGAHAAELFVVGNAGLQRIRLGLLLFLLIRREASDWNREQERRDGGESQVFELFHSDVFVVFFQSEAKRCMNGLRCSGIWHLEFVILSSLWFRN